MNKTKKKRVRNRALEAYKAKVRLLLHGNIRGVGQAICEMGQQSEEHRRVRAIRDALNSIKEQIGAL